MPRAHAALAVPCPAEAAAYGVFRPAFPMTISPDRILRVHGYRDLTVVRPAIRKAAVEIGKRAEGLFSPEVHYRRLSIRARKGSELILGDGISFCCDAFERLLADAHEVVVAVSTMGDALDREVIAHLEANRFEPLEALFLETCGWLGIEVLTKQFGDYLRGLGRDEGFRVTCRMGPGYSYKVDGRPVSWPLEQQAQMFAAFQGYELPVRLLQSCAMLPKMSRSGMFGLAPLH